MCLLYVFLAFGGINLLDCVRLLLFGVMESVIVKLSDAFYNVCKLSVVTVDFQLVLFDAFYMPWGLVSGVHACVISFIKFAFRG